MPAERFYSPDTFKEKETLLLADKEAHHLIHVMRITNGDSVELVNGRGALAKGCCVKIRKREVEIEIKEVFQAEPPKTFLLLAQALPRLNRLETIIEKGTELGMDELWLFSGEKSEKAGISPGQFERLKGIAIAAMKQCGRLYLPQILQKPPIVDWKILPLEPLFFGDINPDAPPLIKEPGSPSMGIVIGPESGFTQQEENHLHHLGAKGVQLHCNILRTDTAAITSLALLSSKTYVR